MAFKKNAMDDYVDVAERIRQFYERYPDGRLTRLGKPEVLEVGNRLFVLYTALAYRTPDDPQPCTGTAWEPFPGPTSFTKDSELMNAETSAIGRAIVNVGIPSKKIASLEEVRNRQPEPKAEKPKPKGPTIDKGTADSLVNAIKVLGATTGTVRMWLTDAEVDDTSDVRAAIGGLTEAQADVLGARIDAERERQNAQPQETLA